MVSLVFLATHWRYFFTDRAKKLTPSPQSRSDLEMQSFICFFQGCSIGCDYCLTDPMHPANNGSIPTKVNMRDIPVSKCDFQLHYSVDV